MSLAANSMYQYRPKNSKLILVLLLAYLHYENSFFGSTSVEPATWRFTSSPLPPKENTSAIPAHGTGPRHSWHRVKNDRASLLGKHESKRTIFTVIEHPPRSRLRDAAHRHKFEPKQNLSRTRLHLGGLSAVPTSWNMEARGCPKSTWATPAPTVSTRLEILSELCSSAMDRRRRSITRRSLSGTGMSMLSGHVSVGSRSTFVPIPPLLSTKSVILLTSTSLPFTHLAALQISRIPAFGQHPHGAG